MRERKYKNATRDQIEHLYERAETMTKELAMCLENFEDKELRARAETAYQEFHKACFILNATRMID